MNKKQTEDFDTLLRRLLIEHLEKRRGIEASKDNLSEYAIEMEERATNEQMVLGLETIDDQAGGRIAAIENALYRLRAGVYDTCETCGGTISFKRLQAVPWTTQCIDCISEAERRRGR